MPSYSRLTWVALLSTLFCACATTPVRRTEAEQRQAFSEICSIGRGNQEVMGSVWMKVETPDEKGQFPAQLKAANSGQLNMEITNLVGGVEATLKIHDGHYEVKWTGREQVVEKGTGQWRGIPLAWAVDLFLGRIPCPVTKGERRALKVELDQGPEGQLIVRALYASHQTQWTETFEYEMKTWAGKPWPVHLNWKKQGPGPTQVSFDFEDPSDHDAGPQKWSAVSDSGEVKIRWKDRSVSP